MKAVFYRNGDTPMIKTKIDMDKEKLKSIYYYLFTHSGINHPEHIKRLEKLSRGCNYAK